MHKPCVEQLPLALKLRHGKLLDSFVAAEQSAVLPLLESLLGGDCDQAYLHGAAGTGKSHLLEACVGLAEARGVRAWWVSVRQLRSMPPEVFDNMEADIGFLALDDIDVLAGDAGWEEALFHLYNRMRAQEVTLLFSGTCAPRQAGFTLPDLGTRLGAGPVVALSLPDEDGLMQMVQQQAAERGLEVGHELAQYLVTRAPRHPAQLLELLEKLDHAALAGKRRLTIPFVKQQLGW